MRVFSYARQSSTREEDSGSCADQLASNRAFAASQGWTIAAEYSDQDAPHYALEKRTGWLDMVLDAPDAGVTAVLVDDASRAWRTTEIQHVLYPALREAGISVVITPSMKYPTTPTDDPAGNMMGSVMTAANTYYIAEMTRKVRRAKARRAREGLSSGGGRRPFGWVDSKRSAINQEEAALIREAADRILKGESSNSVVDDWFARGIKTSAGNPWKRSNFTRMLRNPSLIGKRRHHEKLYQAVWDPILDELTQQAMCGELDRRRRWRPGGPGERALLSGIGILFCGRCRARMRMVRPGNGGRAYRCFKQPGTGSCGRVSILADELEQHVAERLTELVPYKDIAEWYAKAQEPSGRYAEVLTEIDRRETMVDQLLDDFDAGLIDRDRYLDRLRNNNSRLEALREELRELEAERHEFIDVLYHPPTTEDFTVVVERDMSKEEQEAFRKALRAFVERIEVGPANRQIPQVPFGPRADLSRVKITPKYRL